MRRISFLISMAYVCCSFASAEDLLRIEERRIVMGVECHLTMFAPEEDAARQAARDVFAHLEVVEQAISSWRPTSEASMLVGNANQSVQLSPVLFDLLWRSLNWSQRSTGAFDPTLGPLADVWRAARSAGKLPDPADISVARERCGWNAITLDFAARSARIGEEGMKLDFGGIGKGYAADQALKVLRSHGISRALINIGGDLVAGNAPPGTSGWRVEIASLPNDAPRILEIESAAVASSGDVEQFLEVDGVRYSHIFDPRSGAALKSNVQVTAIVRGGDSPGADADALASAASVLASDRPALERVLLGLPGSEVRIVRIDGDVAHVERCGPTPLGVTRPGEPLEVVFDDGIFTEGPAANAAGDVYFTDQPNDRIMVIRINGEVETAVSPSGRANGLAFDQAGDLWACADLQNELWRISENGEHEVVIGQSEVPPFNGPNDVWIAPDQTMYFTDPYYQRSYWTNPEKRRESEAVYRYDPQAKALSCVATEYVRPNGIVGTPDGRTLFVADIGDGTTWSYSIAADGSLGERRAFCSRGSDGMTLDALGNLYLTGDGVHVYAPDGEYIQWIPIPERWTSNVCIGGKDRQVLFITAMGRVYRIPLVR